MKLKSFILNIVFLLLINASTFSQIKSQWRGFGRDGKYSEGELQRIWPEGGPVLKWECAGIGSGWGSPSIYQGTAFITGKQGNLEYCSAINKEGVILWKVPIGDAWYGSYPDARSTPTVLNGKVYVITGQGQISCINAKDGNINWTKNAYTEFAGKSTMWGSCESLLIVDDKLIYTPGGYQTHMVALDIQNGNLIWKTRSIQDSTAYVSPLAFVYQGKEIITSISANYFFGINSKNGDLLWMFKYSDLKWQQTHKYTPVINCNTPIINGNEIFISKGYNHLAAMFRVNEKGRGVELIRTDSVLDVHHGGMVLHDGYIYGSNWINSANGNWCCVDWKTGRLMYEETWKNKGSIIYADSMLYCYEERI